MTPSTSGEEAGAHSDLPVRGSRNYKLIYRKRKENRKQYELIKESNRKWIAAHPEINAHNQRLTRQRRTERKRQERNQKYPSMVKVGDVARQLGVTRQRTHQLIQQGALGQVERDGKIVLVHQHAIDAYLEAKRQRDALSAQ